MIVPVRCEGGKVLEWGLIELQGSIQLQAEWDSSQGLPVGTIQASPANPDLVHLTIGYHLLEGKKLPLKKPLVILAKHLQQQQHQQQQPGCSQQGHHHLSTPPDGAAWQVAQPLNPQQTPTTPAAAADGAGLSGTGSTGYQVVGVLRHKYLFKTRAKALISKPIR